MKHLFAILAMMLGVNSYAQFDDYITEGMPTLKVERQLCVQDAEEHNGRSIQRTASVQENAPLRAIGSPKIVVCLVQFPDAPFTVANDVGSLMSIFDTFFNGKDCGAGDNPYSVADYFRAMSDDKFTPEFVITEPITLSKQRRYYGNVNGSDRRKIFRNEALDSLASRISGRVGELDTNDDNMIDGVILVFTGCGANVGDEEGMHPACWTGSVTRMGITYATELVAPELLGMDETASGGENNAQLNGIGVFVHEMSHMLGLPDFYDLNYTAPGMDYWSLMDYGEYWQNGYRPTPYTAYERNYMGWLSLIELSSPTHVSHMKALGDGGSVYVIYNDGNRNEYYILENRTVSDPWSKSLCTTLGSGMMIYHVDYDATAWSGNRINTNASRQRMTIIPANGHFEICDNLMGDMSMYISEMRGHLWPLKNVESVLAYWGIAGNNALTDEERTEGDRIAPAARLYTRNTDGTYLMHKPITDIAFDNTTNTISFSFMGGTPSGIHSLNSAQGTYGDNAIQIFTLDGRRVQKIQKGIYIVNGKKVIK